MLENRMKLTHRIVELYNGFFAVDYRRESDWVKLVTPSGETRKYIESKFWSY
jgi:hypothetical protein